MSCCAPGADTALPLPGNDEIALAARALGDGVCQIDLVVPNAHCAGCIAAVETAVQSLGGVISARLNLTTRRIRIRWRGTAIPPIVATLAAAGYPPHLFDQSEDLRDRTLGELIRALAVAGFAAGNIMLLSVSVWSGAEGATRDLFHYVSALIALPALVYSGRIFFRSAFGALKAGRTNMDVPIAIGVALAYAMSLYETATGGEHAYFDAAVTLLFFLLIGRTLDHVMREKARNAVTSLARMQPRGALIINQDGSRDYRPLAEIAPGMHILAAAGERIPVDGAVICGRSDVDAAIVTGESVPLATTVGSAVKAGMMNLTGPLTIEVSRRAGDSFLAEMMHMLEMADGGRSRYRRLADRVSTLYAPVVHLAAFAAFLFWVSQSGDWHQALTIAIAVLIITCPCALGLAVPIVQVLAARRLFEAGIMVKDGAALEKLATVDAIVFDKTGTLTLGTPRLLDPQAIDPAHLQIAAALGSHSRHPLARAIAAYGDGAAPMPDDIEEVAGCGIEARIEGALWRLGRAEWATGSGDGTVLARDGVLIARFAFRDEIRPGAAETMAELRDAGIGLHLLSGDSTSAVHQTAGALGIENWTAQMMPAQKQARIGDLKAAGQTVMMVGDGINDAPALKAADVSMAPSSAADIGRQAADLVFLRGDLGAVTIARTISLRADRLIKENIALAIGYNLIAVPIALTGHVTPLIAAIAMSASSLVVIANSLRMLAGGEAKAGVFTSERIAA